MEAEEKQIAPRDADRLSHYLAGLIDGEGSFIININRVGSGFTPALRIRIASTDREPLEAIRDMLGYGYVYPITRNSAGRGKGFGLWISHFERIKEFVKLIDGKLLIKKDELEVFKEAMSVVDKKRRERGIRKDVFRESEILKLCELRDKIRKRHDDRYRDKEWFAQQLKRVEG
jgi:hypothetical protein